MTDVEHWTDTPLAVAVAVAPVAFVWHFELAAVMQGLSTATFSNGFWWFSGAEVYHLAVYALFTVNAVAAYRLATR